MANSLDNLNSKIFAEHLRTQFKVQPGTGGPIMLELVEVTERDASAAIELFSLHFRGPFLPRLQQQIHKLEHDKLGELEIFLTALSADQENGTLYESVFHRLRKQQE